MYNARMKNAEIAPGVSMPLLGFGTWRLDGAVCADAVRTALEIGYRHIDTAEHYHNEDAVGRAITESGVPREEVFIASKIWRDMHRHDDVIRSCEASLKKLGTGYLDLLLIHFPNSEVPVSETLFAMEELRQSGNIRAIGVSNFTRRHLEEALAAGVHIANIQNEFHPSFWEPELLAFCRERNISATAYSPNGQGNDLAMPEIREIAQKHGRSPAQVILRWIMQKGVAAIPKATRREYIEDNFASLEWELPEKDCVRIDALNTGVRMNNPPYAEFDR